MRPDRGAIALTVVSSVASAAVVLDVTSLVRTVLVIAFLFLCPGTAVVRPFQLRPLMAAVLAVAVSLTSSQVVAMLLMYSGLWHPTTAVLLLATVTVTIAWLPTCLTHPSKPRPRRSAAERQARHSRA